MDSIFIFAFIVLILAFGFFWIKMLVKAATELNGADKIVWVLILLFTGIIGALVFAFVRPGGSGRWRTGIDRLTDEDREMLRNLRHELEQEQVVRRGIVLTPSEERMIAEMRRAYESSGPTKD